VAPARPFELAQPVQDFGVGVLLADEEVGGDLGVQPLLGDLVEELLLELVDVADGLEDHVQLGHRRFPGNGRHQVFESLKLDGRRRRRLFFDPGPGLNSAEGIRRRRRRRRRRGRRRRLASRRTLHSDDHLGVVFLSKSFETNCFS